MSQYIEDRNRVIRSEYKQRTKVGEEDSEDVLDALFEKYNKPGMRPLSRNTIAFIISHKIYWRGKRKRHNVHSQLNRERTR